MERVVGKKIKILVKAQIKSSQAAEFSSKAGNRWMGTAARGAVTSLEKLPRRVLQAGTSAQHCCSRGCRSVPVDGWSHSPWICHFGEKPTWGYFHLPGMYACLFPGFAHCSRRRKMHQRLIMFLSLTFLKYAVGPVMVSIPLYPFEKHSIALSPC